ncbi:hypothetical protein [Chthonobacter rhizosphaerae]|uniref:hypothetical protein n=1 Tax=Chthonobacter rhizosphaerae TaxID=2735553 RepID=UPI0015EE745C|nr:hypothetical protein [Chthonobacter rhizosphaerae]
MSLATSDPPAGGAGPRRRLSRAALQSRAASEIAATAGVIALCAVATALPLVLHLVHTALAVSAALAVSVGIGLALPRAMPSAILFNAMFQTMIVSILSPALSTPDELSFIRGYGFILSVGFWSVAFGRFALQSGHYTPTVRRLVLASTAVLAVIGLYMAAGLPANGAPALIYTRNFALPILLFQICLLTAARERVDFGRTLMVLAVPYLAFGYVEFLARDAWMTLTNGRAFWTLALEPLRQTGAWIHALETTGRVVKDITDSFDIVLFNTAYLAELGIKVERLSGPNIHAISYGYCLAFLVLYLVAGGRGLVALAILPLIVFASAKGAIVVLLVVLGGLVASRLFGPRLGLAMVVGVLGVYAVVNTVVGLAAGDFHVLGLMGGLHGFLEQPLGWGIGYGGNLDAQMTPTQWEQAQRNGYTPYALESSIGVLVYQLGLASLPILAFYCILSFMTWRLYSIGRSPFHGIAAFGLLTVLVNGLFQEEALFSILAMGLMVSFAGVALGSAFRGDPARTDRAA